MAFNFTITSTAKIARLHGVKVLVYGRAGAGKTRLVATAPRPLLISAESGLLSLRGQDIPVVEVSTVEQLADIHRFCAESAEAKNYDTVCLDSLTEIGETVLASAKQTVKDQRQAYVALIDQMQLLVKDFRDLQGKHVYFTAQEDRAQTDDGATLFQPAMPGRRLGLKTPYHFDEVFRLEIMNDPEGSPHRVLRTQANFACDAKDRSGALAELEPAHLGHIFKKILATEGPTKEKK